MTSEELDSARRNATNLASTVESFERTLNVLEQNIRAAEHSGGSNLKLQSDAESARRMLEQHYQSLFRIKDRIQYLLDEIGPNP